jgi:hypothetical protein
MHAALLKQDGRANFLIGVSDYRAEFYDFISFALQKRFIVPPVIE